MPHARRYLALICVTAACAEAHRSAPTEPPHSARPARLILADGDAQRGEVGKELPSAIMVRVVDSLGAPVVGQIIAFRVTAGGGSTYAGIGITDLQGRAADRWTLGTIAVDSQRVEARAVDPATGAPLLFGTFQATAIAGPAAQVTRQTPDSQSAVAGTRVAVAPAVRVADRYGNALDGVHVSFRVAAGGGTASDTGATTDGGGIAATKTWTLGATPGVNSLLATVAGLPPASFRAVGTAVPARPSLVLSTTSLLFTATVGDATTPDQTVAVESSGVPISNVGASIFYATGQPTGWLRGSFTASTPAQVTVHVVPTSLAAGVYTATVQVSASAAANSPQNIAVVLVVASATSGASLCQQISGASVIANDGTFLGTLTSKSDARSVLNTFGLYGSQYSATSIWNTFGQYGSAYSALSAFNPYTSTPPILAKDGDGLAYLTVNGTLTPRVDPRLLGTCTFP